MGISIEGNGEKPSDTFPFKHAFWSDRKWRNNYVARTKTPVKGEVLWLIGMHRSSTVGRLDSSAF
jgi:hypothetical protein